MVFGMMVHSFLVSLEKKLFCTIMQGNMGGSERKRSARTTVTIPEGMQARLVLDFGGASGIEVSETSPVVAEAMQAASVPETTSGPIEDAVRFITSRGRLITPDQKEGDRYSSLTDFAGYLIRFHPLLSPRTIESGEDDAMGFVHDRDANTGLLVIASALFEQEVPRRLVNEVGNIVARELSTGIASGGAKVLSGELIVGEFGRRAQEILFYTVGTEPNESFLKPSPPDPGTR